MLGSVLGVRLFALMQIGECLVRRQAEQSHMRVDFAGEFCFVVGGQLVLLQDIIRMRRLKTSVDSILSSSSPAPGPIITGYCWTFLGQFPCEP